MNDTILTIAGNLVDEPRLRVTGNGVQVANFRVASTSRRFDKEQGRFVDGASLYISVTAWRQLGVNVADSLHKGHPVVVVGRFSTREYKVDEQPRSSYELEAIAVGHDLARGTTAFTKVSTIPSTVTIDHDADGLPRDESDRWLDLAEPAEDDPMPESDSSAESDAGLDLVGAAGH